MHHITHLLIISHRREVARKPTKLSPIIPCIKRFGADRGVDRGEGEGGGGGGGA